MKNKILMVLGVLTAAIVMAGCSVNVTMDPQTGNVNIVDLTDPSKELRFNIPVNNANVTFDEVYNANTRDKIFSRHSTVLLNIDDEVGLDRIYNEADFVCQSVDWGLIYADKFENWQYVDIDGTKTAIKAWFAMDKADEDALREPLNSSPTIDWDVTEDVLDSVTDNGDGTLTVATIIEHEGSDTKINRSYIVDAATLELKKFEYTVTENGKETVTHSVDVIYDEGRPDDITKFVDQIVTEKAVKNKNTRTITAIYDYDTEEQETYSLTFDQSIKVSPIFKPGYTAYLDPEKKEIFAGGDGVSDYTYYVFRDEEAPIEEKSGDEDTAAPVDEEAIREYDGVSMKGKMVLETIKLLAYDDDALPITVSNIARTQKEYDALAGDATGEDWYIRPTFNADKLTMDDEVTLLKEAADPSNPRYIDPQAEYYGRVSRTVDTGTPLAISFFKIIEE